MVTKSLKQLLGLAFVTALVAGCASTTEEPEAMNDPPATVGNGGSDAVIADPPPVVAPAPESVFYFEFDSSVLNAEARQALQAHATLLKSNSQRVRLEGHCDERGTREYNQALGARRANAAADYLVLQGVSRSRIETISYGEEQPAMSGSGESAWAKNRRVELE